MYRDDVLTDITTLYYILQVCLIPERVKRMSCIVYLD